MKTVFLCVAHALTIVMARVNGDPMYKLYWNDRCLKETVEELLKVSGVDFSNGGVFKNFDSFSSTFRITKLLFGGLYLDRVMFTGNTLSAKKLHLHITGTLGTIITNLKAAMAKKYVCNGCDTLYVLQPSVTKFAPCVLLRHPILKISPSIVVHVTGIFSVRSVSRII